MKDWRCIIIFLSGLLSTSMFFYGLAAVYWLSELVFVRKRFGIVLLLVLGVGVSYQLTKDNDAVSYLVWDRFEWDSKEGRFAGSTRGGEIETAAIDRIRATGEIWFGVKDKDAYWDEMRGTASINNIIAMHGIVFVTLYIAWLLVVGYRYKNNWWDYLLYCFVVVGCLYQRPDIFSLPHTFLFVCTARYYELQLTDENASNPGRILSRKVTAFRKVCLLGLS